MIAKRIPHKAQCDHPQTPYARRKCRAAKLAAAIQLAEEAKKMKPRYTVFSMNARSGQMWYVIDSQNNGAEVYRSREERDATGHAEALNRQAAKPTPAIEAQAAKPATGWSKAARRRAGLPTGPVDTVGQALGMARTSRYTDCHYCGLNPRTCDCN